MFLDTELMEAASYPGMKVVTGGTDTGICRGLEY
jgi:hypothetical protein